MLNQYCRYFINLYQEDKCCTLQNKEAVGRCRIETKSDKGKIYIWAQNLYQGSYDVYLINANEKNNQKSVLIDNMIVDGHGYAELNREFDANKIFNTDIKIQDINIIAITPKDKKSVVALYGYKNSKIKWRENFDCDIKNSKDTKKETQNQDKKNESDNQKQDIENTERNVNQKIERESKQTENQKEKDITNKEIKNESKTVEPDKSGEENKYKYDAEKKISQDKKDKENIKSDIETKFDIKDLFTNKQLQIKKDIKSKSDNYKFITEEELDTLISKNKIKNKIDDYKQPHSEYTMIDFMFDNNLVMTPFEKQNKNIRWIRISLREIINLPLDYRLYSNHPFILAAYYKNKHMILGEDIQINQNYKNKSYILGLPDRYQPEYKVVLNKLNFVQFKCCRDKKPVRDDCGYWLMQLYQ